MCKRCGYIAGRSDALLKHLRRKFECTPKLSNVSAVDLLKQACVRERVQFNKDTLTYDCQYCDKKYKSCAGKSYHMKRCKGKKAAMAAEEIKTVAPPVKTAPQIAVIAPTHQPVTNTTKYKRVSIPKSLRIAVWNKQIGLLVGKSKCPCCETVDIYQIDFECAHIEASAKGGATNLDNLMPVCFPCNRSMGTTNLYEFQRHFRSVHKQN